MLKNKEEEVWNEMSTTLDNLDREKCKKFDMIPVSYTNNQFLIQHFKHITYFR